MNILALVRKGVEIMKREEMLRASERELQQIQEAITHVVMRNESCRAEFVRNPRAAIKKYLNIELPAELNISVFDQSDRASVFFVLPHCLDRSSTLDGSHRSIKESQLQRISGGFGSYYGIPGIKENGLPDVSGLASMAESRINGINQMYNLGLGIARLAGGNTDHIQQASQVGNIVFNNARNIANAVKQSF